MEKESDAEAAISKLHNSEFDGAKINVELSHGKSSGGPSRRRMNRQPRRDFRDDRFGGPRGPYDRDSHRGMGGPAGYPPMRDGRYDAPPSWGIDPYPPYSSRGPRGYDSYSNGAQGRYSGRDYDRDPRSGSRDRYYGGGYQGPAPEPVPPPRDMSRRASPGRSRYDSYGNNYGDYNRYRDHAQTSSGSADPPLPAPRTGDYYDNYGSYETSSGYDYS